MSEKLIEIALPKCRVILTEAEMRKLLYSQPDIYRTGLKRGKAILRSRQREERTRE